MRIGTLVYDLWRGWQRLGLSCRTKYTSFRPAHNEQHNIAEVKHSMASENK